MDAWLLADQHIKVKGQNNKLYSLSEACQDVVAYEKLTDDVSFCKVIYLFVLFIPFFIVGFWSLGDEVRKIFFYILQDKMGKTGKKVKKIMQLK